jgi:hypothetical protein
MSRRSPQYSGKTSISILIISMTFITPPAWCSTSIIVASHSFPVWLVENGEPFLRYAAPRKLNAIYPAKMAQKRSVPFQ